MSRLLRLVVQAALISATVANASSQIAHRGTSPFTCPALDTSTTCPLPQPKLPHPPNQTPPQHASQQENEQPPPSPPPSSSASEPKPSESPSPWSRGPICRRAGHSEYCAFTHSSFSSGTGISLITTPSRILLLGSQPPLNLTIHSTPESQPPANPQAPPYKDVPIPGKGIGLVATEPIRAGRLVMAATPAVMVDDKAFRGLRKEDLAMLLGQAIVSLPAEHSGRFLNLSADARAADEGQGQLDLVWKIFSTNAFRTPVVGIGAGVEGGEKIEGWEKEMDFQSTFVEVSRLNHACSPNLGYYFDSATLSHRVYAVKDILPGEELTISYVDVLQPSTTRNSLLSKTWSFTCTCPRCMLEPHLLEESNSRSQSILSLRRELDDYSTSASPQKAELLITLYELEGLQVRIYEAYYRAALEWNGVGDSGRAVRYARMCLDKGLLLRGPNRPFVDNMKELVADPTGHWSWRFRLKNAEKEESAGSNGSS
ncbi:hypothetical protein B0T16DRAFT_325814 [Cercophora newfieldiana]|uniref:SET domain-containing protein n=1 Tax=Cercophora newfieldiana TaxID=92897 RepID=A0AA39YAP5_9PEZI|nr:hypothetical protein B0T16DRAFT_325814 [Cercophora newfieldiana]